VVFMDQGRIVETADPDAFFTNPKTDRARQFLVRYGSERSRK
jgi:ABC-type polar amino acid transport system ATPase subunit